MVKTCAPEVDGWKEEFLPTDEKPFLLESMDGHARACGWSLRKYLL
ncbi:MAG: hypothetical protein ACR2OX_06490 [Methyloligellaceae bacterium]